jgi:hypothetical protein
VAFHSLGSERAKGKGLKSALRAFLGGVQCSRMERKRISETNRASMERINLLPCLVSCHFHIFQKKIDKFHRDGV